MVSWRDNASSQAQHDLDGLLELALGFARQQLAQHGAFVPYAVVVRTDGQTEMVAARPDAANDRPGSIDVIAACRTALAERRDHLRPAVVITDVRQADGSDAIQAELEHTEGAAVTVLLPYSKKRFGRGFDYGQLRASAGTRSTWSA